MALSLLKQKLPPYVVNCILSSGFDEIEVLCSMDIDQKRGNSIEIIEKFIQKKFSSRTDHNPFTSDMPFEFPPGHRVRICNVIKEIRQLKESHLYTVIKHLAQKRESRMRMVKLGQARNKSHVKKD